MTRPFDVDHIEILCQLDLVPYFPSSVASFLLELQRYRIVVLSLFVLINQILVAYLPGCPEIPGP